jgi:hypothetical protein
MLQMSASGGAGKCVKERYTVCMYVCVTETERERQRERGGGEGERERKREERENLCVIWGIDKTTIWGDAYPL